MKQCYNIQMSFTSNPVHEESGGEASQESEATTQKSALEILLGDISSKSSVHTPEDELERKHKNQILTH